MLILGLLKIWWKELTVVVLITAAIAFVYYKGRSHEKEKQEEKTKKQLLINVEKERKIEVKRQEVIRTYRETTEKAPINDEVHTCILSNYPWDVDKCLRKQSQ